MPDSSEQRPICGSCMSQSSDTLVVLIIEEALDNLYTSYALNVYGRCMSRTNILINDELLDIVMRRYGLHTKTEAVDVALRNLAGRPMTTSEALSMRGAKLVSEVVDDQAPR